MCHLNRAQADYIVQGIRDDFRVAHLHNEGLAPGMMKSYLAAVRHEQISMSLGDLHIAQMPQLEYVLKETKTVSVGSLQEASNCSVNSMEVERILG